MFYRNVESHLLPDIVISHYIVVSPRPPGQCARFDLREIKQPADRATSYLSYYGAGVNNSSSTRSPVSGLISTIRPIPGT